MKIRLNLLSLCLGVTSIAVAQVPSINRDLPLPTDKAARGPSMLLAVEAAQTAVSVCSARGANVSASVVDSAGVLKALVAADGANHRAVVTSTGKARAANAFKMTSGELADKIKTDATLLERVKANSTVYMPGSGAMPLLVDGEVIGAIGVGGAHGAPGLDENCARAGLEKIQARLK